MYSGAQEIVVEREWGQRETGMQTGTKLEMGLRERHTHIHSHRYEQTQMETPKQGERRTETPAMTRGQATQIRRDVQTCTHTNSEREKETWETERE